jgi:GNAT superfamily N-acetyltransferase
LKGIQINTGETYEDAIIIGDMLSKVWNDNVKSSDYDLIFKYLKMFPEGHIIARKDNNSIGSSIAFPIDTKPSIEVFSLKHPYDFFSIKGKLYYIHVIQVLPEFRNKGIGSKILERQITVAKENRCNYVTGFSIDREINRWERKGFKSIGDFGEYKNFGKVK